MADDLDTYANAQYVRNVRLTFDRYDPETGLFVRTERNMLAEVAEIITPELDRMGVPHGH